MPADPAPRYNATTVEIASTTADAIIYCTLDGSAPTTAMNGFVSPVTVSVDGQTTIGAIAISGTTAVSPERQATIDFQVGPVSISPAGSIFFGAVTVSLATETNGAQIYYTLDGSDPRSSGTAHVYTGPFGRESDTTVLAYATKSGYSSSAVAERSYTASAWSLYDDSADGSINTGLWTDGSVLGGRVFEADVFIYPDSSTVSAVQTINVYGRNYASGQTGNGALTSVGAGTGWRFDIVHQYMGAQAGGAQGWAIYALNTTDGSTVQVSTKSSGPVRSSRSTETQRCCGRSTVRSLMVPVSCGSGRRMRSA